MKILVTGTHTAVDRAESERKIAQPINAVMPGGTGTEAKRIDARLIHYSIDYLFAGVKSRPRR